MTENDKGAFESAVKKILSFPVPTRKTKKAKQEEDQG